MAEQTFNDRVIEQYRATGGAVTMLYEDSTLVLVTMRGARSGREITLPLESMEWDGVLHLFATKSGAPTNPSWYYNLLANPDVTVEHGRETFAAHARLLERDDRDRMWRRLVELKPRFAEYEQKTDRAFPVFALDRFRAVLPARR
jgi:deazaflavin-dependent oxidoreductase (nitroreductase family)